MREDYEFGCLITFVVVIMLAVFVFVYMSSKQDQREHTATCAHLMTLARTAHDTLEVSLRCELSASSQTQVVPVVTPIYIPTR